MTRWSRRHFLACSAAAALAIPWCARTVRKSPGSITLTGPGGAVATVTRNGLTRLGRGQWTVPLGGAASGFSVHDPVSGNAYPVTGQINGRGGGVSFQGAVPGQNLRVVAEYAMLADGSLAVSGSLQDTSGTSRVSDVVFTLPTDVAGGLWQASTVLSTPITSATGEQVQTDLPFAAVVGPSDRFSVAYAIPPDSPCRFQLGYSTGAFSLLLKFGLSPAASGALKSQAPFSFVIDVVDPRWGIRDALDRYYARHASWFEVRVTRFGLWQTDPSGTYSSFDPALYAYHEAGSAKGAATTLSQLAVNDGWAADQARHIYTLPYIMPGQLSVVTGLPLTTSYAQSIAAFNQAQPAPIDFASYETSNSYPSSGTLKEWIKSSAVYTSTGIYQIIPRLSALGQPEVTFVVNPSPTLASSIGAQTLGQYLRDTYVPMLLRSADVDGVYTDSLGGWGVYYNYRQDHFTAERVALTYNDSVLQPAILNHVSITEFLWALREALHPRGKLVMGNDTAIQVSPPPSPSNKVLPFASFALDVVAAEVSETIGTPVNAAAYRCLAYRKPTTLLEDDMWEDPDAATRDNIEKVSVLQNLFLASFPFVSATQHQTSPHPTEVQYQQRYVALGQTLAAAGWQPVTGVLLGNAEVLVERYGSGPQTYLVFYNTSPQDVSTSLTIDQSANGFPSIGQVTEVLSVDGPSSSLQAALVHGGVATMAPQQLSVLRLG